MEIASRQLTVDFVNRSQSSSEVAVNRADLAEVLGDANRRYQVIASDVSERLKQLNSLQLLWNDYESHVDCLTRWFAKQDEWLGGLTRLHDRGAVQHASMECRVCISFLIVSTYMIYVIYSKLQLLLLYLLLCVCYFILFSLLLTLLSYFDNLFRI